MYDMILSLSILNILNKLNIVYRYIYIEVINYKDIEKICIKFMTIGREGVLGRRNTRNWVALHTHTYTHKHTLTQI